MGVIERDPRDPKGLLREAFRIDGITYGECRSIFLDWALSLGADVNSDEALTQLFEHYADQPADHPMRTVMKEGLDRPQKRGRRGGRAARVEGL